MVEKQVKHDSALTNDLPQERTEARDGTRDIGGSRTKRLKKTDSTVI